MGIAELAHDFFDEPFGLGTGDEDRGGHPKTQAVELLVPDDVLNRNSAASSLNQPEEVARCLSGNGLAKPSQKGFSRAAERMPEQKLCLDSRVGDTDTFELRGTSFQKPSGAHEAVSAGGHDERVASASLSFSVW